MNPLSLSRFSYLNLSSHAENASLGVHPDNYTLKDTVDQWLAPSHSLQNLQPLTFHLTHNFVNVPEGRNRLWLLTDYISNSTYFCEIVVEAGQYDITSLLKALNSNAELLKVFPNLTDDDVFFELDHLNRITFGPGADTAIAFGHSNPRLVGTFNGKFSTLWRTLGFYDDTTYPVAKGPISSRIPNLRGPECLWVALEGINKGVLAISNGKPKLQEGHRVEDDNKIFLYVPVNCEFGGVITHVFEDTYCNSIICVDGKGELTNEIRLTVYDHEKRILYLDDNTTFNLLFKHHHE